MNTWKNSIKVNGLCKSIITSLPRIITSTVSGWLHKHQRAWEGISTFLNRIFCAVWVYQHKSLWVCFNNNGIALERKMKDKLPVFEHYMEVYLAQLSIKIVERLRVLISLRITANYLWFHEFWRYHIISCKEYIMIMKLCVNFDSGVCLFLT